MSTLLIRCITDLQSAKNILKILHEQNPGLGCITVPRDTYARIIAESLDLAAHGQPYNRNPWINGIEIVAEGSLFRPWTHQNNRAGDTW